MRGSTVQQGFLLKALFYKKINQFIRYELSQINGCRELLSEVDLKGVLFCFRK